jgi:formate hydrogenlyase subunit 4
METIVRIVAHLLLLVALAPLLQGVTNKTKAWFAGRKGAPVLQPYFDLAKLLRKELVLGRPSTAVLHAGPVVGVAAPLVACLLVPFGGLPAPLSFSGDLLLFVYLFGLARFCTASSALDTGSSFEGMGAAREVTFSCLAEPTVLFCLLVLARFALAPAALAPAAVANAAPLSLNALLGPHLAGLWNGAAAFPLGLVAVCLFVVLLAENSRIPFDDPTTHLELTMIHEVMVLDHGGAELGLVLYGAAMKLLVLGALLLGVLPAPSTGSALLDGLVFAALLAALAALVGVTESVMARLRLTRVPQVLIGTSLLSVIALVLVLR